MNRNEKADFFALNWISMIFTYIYKERVVFHKAKNNMKIDVFELYNQAVRFYFLKLNHVNSFVCNTLTQMLMFDISEAIPMSS